MKVFLIALFPLLPTLLLTLNVDQASSAVAYPLAFANLTSPGIPDAGISQVLVCTTGAADIAINFTLQQTGKNQCTNVSQRVPFNYAVNSSEIYASRDLGLTELNVSLNVFADAAVNVFAFKDVGTAHDGFIVPPLTTTSTEFYLAGRIGTTQIPDTVLLMVPYELGTRTQVYNISDSATIPIYDVTSTSEYAVNQIVFDRSDTTGLYVKASKPINVISVVVCGHVPSGVRYCDYMSEQIPPVAELGLTHIVPPIDGRATTSGYIVRVVATAASTSITTASTSTLMPAAGTTMKSAGEYLEINVVSTNAALQVTCSKPCLVMQYNKGGTAGSTLSDPFMMQTVPTNHFVDSTCFSTPEGSFNHYVAIVTATSHVTSITLDGVAVTSWTDAGTAYSTKTMVLQPGWHTITVTAGSGATFAAYVYGHSTSTLGPRYAYGLVVAYNFTGQLIDATPQGCVDSASLPSSLSTMDIIIVVATSVGVTLIMISILVIFAAWKPRQSRSLDDSSTKK